MRFIISLFTENYLTVMILAAFFVLLLANRAERSVRSTLIGFAMLLTFGIAVLDQTEEWCDLYQKPVWILYIKSALVYTIYPLILLLETFVSIPIKKRIFFSIPLIFYMILLGINAFGVDLIYGYGLDHSYHGGPFNFLPPLLILFYELIIITAAIRMVRNGNRQHGVILLLIAFITIITVVLEIIDAVDNLTDEICALGLLIYFWYLTADYQKKVQEQLYQSRLEAEHNKNKMLMAQIQPHFINNSLMALRARCRHDPEIYESITKFSKYLRSHFDALGGSPLITFEKEMENVEAYLDLERDNYGELLQVEYEIECDQFLVPSLSVQPLVENAVRHGIGTYEEGGTVYIKAVRQDGGYCIEIRDDGSGQSGITAQQKKRKGVGIENVRARLRSMGCGELEIISGDHGTTARITIPENRGGTQ